MSKRITRLGLALMMVMTGVVAFGQEDETNGSKFGLGASLFNYSDFMYQDQYVPNNLIYMTINLGNKFRLEPEVGFSFGGDYETYTLGLGAFAKKNIQKFDLLYGLRLGWNKDDIMTIAPTVGGEYYFIKHFSVGSEVQLKGMLRNSNLFVFTNTAVILRFYF